MIKVEIKGDCLELTPCDGIENYALKCWFENYTSNPSKATLMVNTFTEAKEEVGQICK